MSTHAFAPTFRPFDLFVPASETELAAETTEAADASEVAYALVQSGPAVPADEVECDLEAVEIKAKWGAQVLAVAHLEAGKSWFVGEGTDIALPEEALGASRAAIVERGYAIVPAGAQATVTTRGESIGETFAGPTEIPLSPASSVTMQVGAVTFEISTVRKGKVAKASLLSALATGATGFIGLSLLGHAAIVASMAMFMPAMSNDAESIDRDQMLLMQKFLTAAAERELDTPKPEAGPSEEATGGGAKGGEPHKGEAGAAGTQASSSHKAAHMAFKGDDKESALPTKQEVELFGMIGIMGGGLPRDPNAHSSPWGDVYKGSDAESKMGGLFGETADDMFGYGLGLSGPGEGGGGKGAGVGIDGIGNTVGGGGGGPGKWGYGKGDKDGLGNGHGVGGGHHVAKPPQMREMNLSSNGRLPAEVIQRIVRQNFGRFRNCYEGGLRANPGLTGRVATRFVIDRNGSVSTSQDAGSDLPDQAVTQCVVRSFASLSFPQPEGGIATVTYPIMFTPGQ